MEWLRRYGFGSMMTRRRDLLPQPIPGKYLHKKKTYASGRTKVVRFFEPVVCVTNVPPICFNSAYERVHVSFQYTSSCNFLSVSSLNECSISAENRQRGQGKNKRE